MNENTTSVSSGAMETPMSFKEKNDLINEYVFGANPKMATPREPLEGLDSMKDVKTKGTPPYAGINTKQTEDDFIASHSGGMTDLVYDSLPEKAKEQMKKAVLAGDTEDSKTGQKILDASKKRAESNPNVDFDKKFHMSGSDIEVNPNYKKTKPNIVEQVFKKVKTKEIITEENLDRFCDRLPKALKEDGKVFFVEDCIGNKYKVLWNKTSYLLESTTKKESKLINDSFSRLSKYKPNESRSKGTPSIKFESKFLKSFVNED